MIRTALTLSFCTSALVLAGCGSASTGDVQPEHAGDSFAAEAPAEQASDAPLAAPAVDGEWTSRFEDMAALVADEIHVSGPKGLLDHVVTSDGPDTTYFVKTTKDGLLQERTARDGAGFVKIYGQVDRWRIVATQKVVVLEKPGRVPVVVEAHGNAYFDALDGSAPERSSSLRFVGELGQ